MIAVRESNKQSARNKLPRYVYIIFYGEVDSQGNNYSEGVKQISFMSSDLEEVQERYEQLHLTDRWRWKEIAMYDCVWEHRKVLKADFI